MRNYLATLNNYTILPIRTIYRGSGKYDFYADELNTVSLQIIKEKLVELKEDATVVYRKAGESTKLAADLKKEGKPIATNADKVKEVKK